MGEPEPDRNDTGVFGWCSGCGHRWSTREAMLADPEVALMGYAVNFEALGEGLFLFSHEVCRSTVGLEVAAFLDLHEGPVHTQLLRGSDECPRFCLNERELSPCKAPCQCAFVRDVLTTVATWDKTPAGKADDPGADDSPSRDAPEADLYRI